MWGLFVETVHPCHRTEHCGTRFILKFSELRADDIIFNKRLRRWFSRVNIVALASEASRVRESVINDQFGSPRCPGAKVFKPLSASLTWEFLFY